MRAHHRLQHNDTAECERGTLPFSHSALLVCLSVCRSVCPPRRRLSPASWKDPNGAEITKRTKEQAIEILQKHRQAIVDGKATLADLAKVHSGE